MKIPLNQHWPNFGLSGFHLKKGRYKTPFYIKYTLCCYELQRQRINFCICKRASNISEKMNVIMFRFLTSYLYWYNNGTCV